MRYPPSSFFFQLPKASSTYALNKEVAQQYHIRRYGAHGTSHEFISSVVPSVIGKPAEGLKQIVLHIGNGASASAEISGKPVETSMGLTPLEGVLMGTRGFSFLWPMCMSAFIFTGSMEFVTVNLLVSAFNPFVTFMLAVMLGTRHLFYGISMLGRFKNMGAKKPYLIFSLCDETFAIDNGTIIAADVDRGWFYFFVGLLNQSSWVAGATLGGLLGERITFNTSGLDFIMTAMFAVIFVDQWLTTKRKSHMAALTGIAVPAICLGVFGADNFMIPSLVAMLVMFILLRPYLDDLKIDKTDGENETNNADKETNA